MFEPKVLEPTPDAGLQSVPVLVVDDLPAGEEETRERLEGAGYRAVGEPDGDAVLRLVRASLTRLVVSEIYIPCSEGRCVVTVLKRDRARLPKVRVLVNTRHVTDMDTEWALDTGCDALVRKTAPAAAFLVEVHRLLGDCDEPVPGARSGRPAERGARRQ